MLALYLHVPCYDLCRVQHTVWVTLAVDVGSCVGPERTVGTMNRQEKNGLQRAEREARTGVGGTDQPVQITTETGTAAPPDHPSGAGPREDCKERPSPESAAKQECDSAPRQPNPSPHVVPAPPNPRQPKHSQNIAEPWWKSWDGWKRPIEIVGILGVVFYAIVTYLQWRDLRHNFQVDQRAWVRVEIVLPNVATSSVAMKVTNMGRSPAVESVIDAMVGIIPADRAPSAEFIKGHDRVSFALLFPNQWGDFEASVRSSDGSRRSFTEAEVQGLISGKSYIAVFGQMWYRDQFGLHWTRFCDWKAYNQYPAKFNAGPCVSSNAVGDGMPPAEWPAPKD